MLKIKDNYKQKVTTISGYSSRNYEENDNFTGVKFFSNGNCFFGVDTSGELKLKDGVVVDSKIEKIDINRMLQTKKWKRDKNAWKKINELIDEVNKLKNGGK